MVSFALMACTAQVDTEAPVGIAESAATTGAAGPEMTCVGCEDRTDNGGSGGSTPTTPPAPPDGNPGVDGSGGSSSGGFDEVTVHGTILRPPPTPAPGGWSTGDRTGGGGPGKGDTIASTRLTCKAKGYACSLQCAGVKAPCPPGAPHPYGWSPDTGLLSGCRTGLFFYNCTYTFMNGDACTVGVPIGVPLCEKMFSGGGK